MRNIELVRKCTEPARLCEYRLVQERSTEHSRRRTANRVPLKAHWEERSKDRTINDWLLQPPDQGYDTCRHHLNSSPQDPTSPTGVLFVSIPNRMKISIHQTRTKHKKLWASRTVTAKVLTLSRSHYPASTRLMPWGNKDLLTKINTPSLLVHRYFLDDNSQWDEPGSLPHKSTLPNLTDTHYSCDGPQ